MSDIYKGSVELKAKWVELEKRLCVFPFSMPYNPLSTQRVNGVVRLCYKGVPITEIGMSDMLQAGFDVESFVRDWDTACQNVPYAIEAGNNTLEKILRNL